MRRREKKNDILLYLLKVYKQKVSQEPLTKPCADLRARAGKTGRKMVALVTREKDGGPGDQERQREGFAGLLGESAGF